MDEGLDTGPVLAQGTAPLGEDAAVENVFDALPALVADLLPKALARVEAGDRGDPQSEEGASYAGLYEDEYAEIDWTQPARAVHTQVRCWFLPTVSGIWGPLTTLDGERVRVLETRLADGDVERRAGNDPRARRRRPARAVRRRRDPRPPHRTCPVSSINFVLKVGDRTYEIHRIDAIDGVERLPYTLRILLENVLRTAGDADVDAVAGWVATDEPSREINFSPGRAIHQDFTGVPAIVDLAAMRNAMADMGGDAAKINPLIPAELVIDHSVQVDEFASRFAFGHNVEREFERNRERYAFLRWGQGAFSDLKVVPPGTGIVHQVNLEYLGRVVEERNGVAFPDTLVGTDSHTTMINGLGVLGWGVGGIEAEAAMLGEPLSMLVPQVVGFKLRGSLPEGRDGDRPRAHRHRAAAQDRRRRQVRRVLRRRARVAAGRRPRDDREHVAGVRRDVRLLPGRRPDARVPAS